MAKLLWSTRKTSGGEQQEEAAPAHPLPALEQESAASDSCDRAGPSAPVDEHPRAAADAPPLAPEPAELP